MDKPQLKSAMCFGPAFKSHSLLPDRLTFNLSVIEGSHFQKETPPLPDRLTFNPSVLEGSHFQKETPPLPDRLTPQPFSA
jgi:hypothetical protein